MKNFFKRWFNSPKYVMYVDIRGVETNKEIEYIKEISKKLNIRALYIPTRTSETRLERL